MTRFTIRLLKRDARGNIVPGVYVELETDYADKVEEFYHKITAREHKKKKEKESETDGNTRVSKGTRRKQKILQ
jgi:hypothetical protein